MNDRMGLSRALFGMSLGFFLSMLSQTPCVEAQPQKPAIAEVAGEAEFPVSIDAAMKVYQKGDASEKAEEIPAPSDETVVIYGAESVDHQVYGDKAAEPGEGNLLTAQQFDLNSGVYRAPGSVPPWLQGPGVQPPGVQLPERRPTPPIRPPLAGTPLGANSDSTSYPITRLVEIPGPCTALPQGTLITHRSPGIEYPRCRLYDQSSLACSPGVAAATGESTCCFQVQQCGR